MQKESELHINFFNSTISKKNKKFTDLPLWQKSILCIIMSIPLIFTALVIPGESETFDLINAGCGNISLSSKPDSIVSSALSSINLLVSHPQMDQQGHFFVEPKQLAGKYQWVFDNNATFQDYTNLLHTSNSVFVEKNIKLKVSQGFLNSLKKENQDRHIQASKIIQQYGLWTRPFKSKANFNEDFKSYMYDGAHDDWQIALKMQNIHIQDTKSNFFKWFEQ